MNLDLDTLLHELEAIEGCPRTKNKVRHLLKTLAGRRVYFSQAALVRPTDIHAVRRMMTSGLDGVELFHAVQERFGLRRGAAYRLIRQAMAAQEPSTRVTLDLFL